MPEYSQSSKKRLATCHVDLQTIFNEVIKTHDCSILCGYRSEQEQQKAFINGFSTVEYPNSKHNSLPSRAVDVAPYFADISGLDWEDAKAFAVFAGYVLKTAELLFEQGLIHNKLRWGGDWDMDGRTNDHTFIDLPHFELVNV